MASLALVISVGLAVILGAPGIAVQATQAKPPAATASAARLRMPPANTPSSLLIRIRKGAAQSC